MNDELKELKTRVKQLDSVKMSQDSGMGQFLDFAQALSRVHRLLRRADRSRGPTPELLQSVGRAEEMSLRGR